MKTPWEIVTYDFHRVSVDFNKDFDQNLQDCETELHVSPILQNSKDLKNRWRLSIDITCKPLSKTSSPYTISLTVVGLFDFHDDFIDDINKRAVLIAVNGSAILYSATREFILGITSRCPFGPFALPSWNPNSILQSGLEKNGSDNLE